MSILMYHQIGRYPRPDAHRALFCHIDRFKDQLRYLKVMGFDVINLSEARARRSAVRAQKNRIEGENLMTWTHGTWGAALLAAALNAHGAGTVVDDKAIAERLRVTLPLAVMAMALSVVLALAAGAIVGVVRPESWAAAGPFLLLWLAAPIQASAQPSSPVPKLVWLT